MPGQDFFKNENSEWERLPAIILSNSYWVIHPLVTLLFYPTNSYSIFKSLQLLNSVEICNSSDYSQDAKNWINVLHVCCPTVCCSWRIRLVFIHPPFLTQTDNSAHLNGYCSVNAPCFPSCGCNCLNFPSFSAAFSEQGKRTITSHLPSSFLFTRCGCTTSEFHFYWPSIMAS